MILGLVDSHMRFHAAENGIAMTPLLHVDKVDDDEAADIAQTNLASDFGCRFAVHLEDDVVLLALVFVGAGIDVDGDEGLGFVNDDSSARRQRYCSLEGLLYLILDIVAFENRDAVLVELDLVGRAFGDLADILDDVLMILMKKN